MLRVSKVALALVFGGALAATPTFAQNPAGPPGGQRGPGRMQAMLLQGITLTPAQQAKVDSITTHYRSMMPAMTPGTPPSQADREKAMQLMAASQKDIRAVLTPDQQPTFDKNLAEMQARMQQMRQGGGPPAGGAPAQGGPPPN